MTVLTQGIKAGPFKGTGEQDRFTFEFHLLDEQHLEVWVKEEQAQGQGELLQLGKGYSVQKNEHREGGFITLAEKLAVGKALTIYRRVPITQHTDYVQGESFPAESHERALDKLTHIAQQLDHGVRNAIKVSDQEGEDFKLPFPKDRLNTLLGFDKDEGRPQAVQISDGLIYEEDLLKLHTNVGLIVNQHGISVLYGDGLGVYDNAIVLRLGKGLEFDSVARARVEQELIDLIKANTQKLFDLNQLLGELGVRISKLEEEGGHEVAIYIGNGLSYNEKGHLTVKPHSGISVTADGVSIRAGRGLQFNDKGELEVSSQNIGYEVGEVVYFAMPEAPVGFLALKATGVQNDVSRIIHAELFKRIGTLYGKGDGETTFGLPPAAGRFIRGYDESGTVDQSGKAFGATKEDSIRNITGTLYDVHSGSIARGNGVIKHIRNNGGNRKENYGGNWVFGDYNFDASRSVPTSEENNPKDIRLLCCIYSGHTDGSAVTPSADETLQRLVDALDQHLNEERFTILYPNGGTEEKPAEVTIDQRFVLNNPFGDANVNCAAEIQVNGIWGQVPPHYYMSSSGVRTSVGLFASQMSTGEIVLQTGLFKLKYASNLTFDPFNTTELIEKAPCRIKVWRLD